MFAKHLNKHFPTSTWMAELTDTVLSLKQQGYTNNQIIQYLQSQGYENHQIFDALSQAEAQRQPFVPEFRPAAETPREDMEEIVEGVVEEKWKVFEEGVKKILGMKENELDDYLKKRGVKIE